MEGFIFILIIFSGWTLSFVQAVIEPEWRDLNARLFGFYSQGNAEPWKGFELGVKESDSYNKT